MTTCVILAGGLGSRLRSAVPDLPKCLAPIDGWPFLGWQLHSLAKRGVEHFVLSLGYGADQVLTSIKQPWASGFSIEVLIENRQLGTGGAARFAMENVGLDEALVANGDTYLGGSLQTMLVPLNIEGSEHMRIATVHVPDRARFGGIALDEAGYVTEFLEKGRSDSGLINAGLYRIHRRIFEGESAAVFSIEKQVMPRLAAQGTLQACELTGPFIDIGVPDDYRLFDSRVYDFVNQT